MSLPFDGAITRFLETEVEDACRRTIVAARGRDILNDSYPHDRRLHREAYEAELARLQIELVKLQAWVQAEGKRLALVFEGRDAAGKGGVIARFTQHLNPRVSRIVALGKPSDRERSEWYFQRYIRQLPASGEIVFFDRSWYNRAVIEHVFGFCTTAQRDLFFRQVNDFEAMLVEEGIHLVKIWLNIGRTEQLRRFLARERDPLRQWKLSAIDVQGLGHWNAYTAAIAETFGRSHSAHAPWTVIRADDKRRARLAAIRHVLGGIDYHHRNRDVLAPTDPAICGGPEIWHV